MTEPTFEPVSFDTPEIDAALAAIQPEDFQAKTGKLFARRVNERGLINGVYADLGVVYDPKQDEFVVKTMVMRDCIIRGNTAWAPFEEDIAIVRPGMYLAVSERRHLHDILNVYPIPANTFERKYTASNQRDWWLPKGIARIIRNPYGRPIQIEAPWTDADGNPAIQTGDDKCYLCAPVDPDRPDDLAKGQRYILSFNDRKAYVNIEKAYGPDWRELAFHGNL